MSSPEAPHGEDAGKDSAAQAQGPLGHLEQALRHGEGLVRCYMSELAGGAERRMAGLGWMLAGGAVLVTLVAAGLVMLAVGLARYLDYCIALPGAGLMVMGLALIAGAGAVYCVRAGCRKARKER